VVAVMVPRIPRLGLTAQWWAVFTQDWAEQPKKLRHEKPVLTTPTHRRPITQCHD
jgi:hypothetical protein